MIRLSDHFTYGKLLRFTLPSIGMMLFTSIYGVVDGLFVSNFVGKTPFAAINLIWPFVMMPATLGFMVGTGGSALVSKLMGEREEKKANEVFSLLLYVSMAVAAVLTVLGMVLVRPVAIALGAEGAMLEDCVIYGRILFSTLIFFTLQNEFQSFCIVAERPKLGLIVTVAAGLTNIVLDALFVAAFRWGIVGAAVATAASQVVGGVIPLVYFSLPNGSLLRLGRCAWDPRALWQTCFNGSSELVSSLSMSLVNMLYNLQLMKLAGENGVAAYGVIMYVNFIFVGVFLGYSLGVAPVISFHYGAMNHDELKNLRRRSMVLVTALAVSLTAAALALSAPLARIFVGYDAVLMEMTKRGFAIYAASFLIMGYNMFASSFFTALNNGLISALISFSRALLFQVVAILLLPRFWGVDGVWTAVVAAELASLAVTVICLLSKKKEYHY